MSKCSSCGSDYCPCPLCHGDPKQHLAGSHGGIPEKDETGFPTGRVICSNCGRRS